MSRELKRRLRALEGRGAPEGDDLSQLTPEEFEELLGLWIRVSDGGTLSSEEHARFRALDGKVIKTRGAGPYDHLTNAELDEAIERCRADKRS